MFCPMCGAPNEDDAEFCSNCGAALKPGENPAETASPQEAGAPLTSESAAAPQPEGPVPGAEAQDEPAPAVPPAPPAPAAPPPPRPWAPRTAETSGLAIASLVAGVAGLTFLPLLGSIAAVILGYMARNEIRSRPGELTGEGVATAGIVLGWVEIGLGIVLCCAAIAAVLFFSVTSSGTSF